MRRPSLKMLFQKLGLNAVLDFLKGNIPIHSPLNPNNNSSAQNCSLLNFFTSSTLTRAILSSFAVPVMAAASLDDETSKKVLRQVLISVFSCSHFSLSLSFKFTIRAPVNVSDDYLTRRWSFTSATAISRGTTSSRNLSGKAKMEVSFLLNRIMVLRDSDL